jgi:hypothetical protein
MAVVPGGLDQQPAGVAVAGLGDGAAAILLTRGVLAGDETQEGHQASGRVEAEEVVELGDQAHGGGGVDAAEAAQRGDRFGLRG